MSSYAQKKMRKLIILSIIFVFTALGLYVSAQETLVVGHVRSRTDKSPIASANIYFKDTNIGVQSDEDGFFVIKNTGQESTLIFSCIGYKTKEVQVQPGQTVGVEAELRDDINLLQELFVIPGANPALDLMKQVRSAKGKNDVFNYPLTISSTEQNLVLLSKNTNNAFSRKLFNELADGLISLEDSSHFLPVYFSEEHYYQQGRSQRYEKSRTVRASPENALFILEKLTGELKTNLNFYDNSITLFGKNFVSPLSSAGNTFYRFFLIDSLVVETGKQYYLRYRSKNSKNLAFNGEIWIDSASLAITKITAALPSQANINYVKNLTVSKTYHQVDHQYWYPATDRVSLNMTYQVLADSMNLSPDIFIERKIYSTPHDTVIVFNQKFAGSEFTKDELELKLAEMNDLPLMKTARWLADAVITGYIQAGKIDIGKVYQLARLTDIEGLRFSVPLRTNELLWKDFAVGGYWGYGLRNREHKYSAYASYKLPLDQKMIISVGYTDDLRRIDYNYHDYFLRENPLLSGDEDVSNTFFAFRSAGKINPRKEFYASLSHDWNSNIESSIYLRKNTYAGNDALPFMKGGFDIQNMTHESLTLNTRFSNNERTYEDHLERIYIPNNNPIFYLTLEGGRTILQGNEQLYGKISGKMKQNLLFDFGQWNYNFDAGLIFGTVPYNLLSIPSGSETRLYKQYHYNLMNYMEYAYDKYIAMHHELILNGIIFNQIPGIRQLNLRELVSFKCVYGGLNPKHAQILDFPLNIGELKKPYMEMGVGVTNIFRIFSLQSVWRLTDLNKSQVRSWGIVTGLRFNL